MAHIEKRTRKNGVIVWTVYLCVDGRRLSRSFNSSKGFTKKDAENWAREQEYKLRVDEHAVIRRTVTLSRLVDEYKEVELPQKKSKKSMRVFFDFWKTHLGHKKLNQIKAYEIHKIAAKHHKHPVTYNRYISHMSILFSYAYFNEMVNENPCKKIKKKREHSRERFLSSDEIAALLKETKSTDYLHLIVLIAMTTGCRKSEILGMEWSNLDYEEKSMYIPDTKNGDSKTVYFRPMVWPLIQKWQKTWEENWKGDWKNKKKSDRLFPFDDFRRSWHSAMKAAEIMDFRFHDLRHTFATYLLAQGVSHFDVMKAMGHRNLNSLKVYAHISKERLKEICSAIDSAFEM